MIAGSSAASLVQPPMNHGSTTLSHRQYHEESPRSYTVGAASRKEL
jgi:hypothetical protein